MKKLAAKLKGKMLVGVICAVIVLMGALLLPPLIRTAQAATSGEYEYSVNADSTTATITGYTGAGGDITIPDTVTDGTTAYTVTAIGDKAFFQNAQIANVILSNTITKIGEKSFSGCDDLLSITLSNNLKTIGKEAFSWCENLASIYIPGSVTSIGSYAFDYSSLSTIEVDESNEYYSSEDGVFFNKSKGLLIRFPQEKSGDYSIPESVTEIKTGAFNNCRKLTGIIIPNGVTEIPNEAFNWCISLTTAQLPNGLESIGSSAFKSCMTLNNITLSDGLISIGLYAFHNCTLFTDITIPDSVTTIGSCAFSNCTNLKSIHLSNEITEITYEMFLKCSNLESITIPDGVTKISDEAFKGCTALVEINLPQKTKIVGFESFRDCSSLSKVVLPDQMTKIDEYAFYKCSSLSSINLPSNLTTLEDSTFAFCSSLNSINIPDSVISVESGVFGGCSNLENITFPSGVAEIGQAVFWNCVSLKSFVIPNGVSKIAYNTFNGCSSLISIIVPETVLSIESSAFEGCSSLSIIDIPAEVTSMGGFVFADCSSLISITLPSNIKSIGGFTFENCSSLTSLTIPDGVERIEQGAFDDCINLISITIPNSVNFIGRWSFENCSKLDSVRLPDQLTEISDELFWYCTNLQSVDIPDGVTSIGSSAFSNCRSLTSVTIPDRVASIGAYAFFGCYSLQSINIPAGIESIEKSTFSECNSLTNIVIPNSVTNISDSAFSGCDLLDNIVIPNGVTSIGKGLFRSCASLNNITIPESVVSIESEAFSYCTKLINITIPNSVRSIGNSVFADCRYLKNIFFRGNAPEAGSNLFYGCSGGLTIYYQDGATGFTNPWNGYPTIKFNPNIICTVTFNLNSAVGSSPQSQTLYFGMFVEQPNEPMRSNYSFCGWYTDSNLTDQWDFSTDTVSTDITLYAKWVQLSYLVTASSCNSDYGWVNGDISSVYGATSTLQAIPNSGYRFIYWRKGATKVSENALYTFTVIEDCEYIAEFAAISTPTVTAVSVGYNSVKLDWNEVQGASAYEVWCAVTNTGSYIHIETLSDTTYTNIGLQINTTYYYKVVAYCAALTAITYGSFSVPTSATPVPSAPKLYASPKSYNSAYVAWDAVPGASGYELSRATSPSGIYKPIKTTSSLSYTNTSLGTGTTYYYKVRAYRTVGRTKVYGNYSIITAATPMLSSVASATASAYYPTSVKISWSSVPGRTKYEVWRSTTPTGGFGLIKSTTSTYYKDTTCTPFVTYYYQIRVYRTVSGQKVYGSSTSPTASATPILGNVTGVGAAMSSPSSNKVSWASVTGASGYEVWRSTTADSGYVLVKSTSSRSYTDSNLIPNTTYYYQVRAYRKVGGSPVPSALSAPVSATPYFRSVLNPKAVRSSATKIKLTWSAVSGRTGYEVYRSTLPDSGFVLIKSTTSTSFTDSGLTTGVTYYYKICAYRTVNGVKYRSTDSVIVSATP